MTNEKCQKTVTVAESSADDDSRTTDDAESTPCLNPGMTSERLSPLRVGKRHSLSLATMAKCNVTATKYKGRLLRLLLGTTLVAFASSIWLLDPVELCIRKLLAFHNGSYLYENWRNPPVPIKHKIFVFNVTNADGFLHHGEKLRVEEVGPYTYSETLENKVLTFNDNGTVTYIPSRTETFSEEFSEKNARKDIVVVPNLTLIALVSMAQKVLPFYLKALLPTVLAPLNMQPFICITVDELILGYDDPLVTLGNTFISSYIPMSKLGLLDIVQRQNDTITMLTMPNDPSRSDNDLYSIDVMNGSPGLDFWGYGKTYVEAENGTVVPELRRCNSVRGTFEGVIMPRYYPENETLWIFRKYCCRPLPAVFDKNVTEYGLKLRQYKLKEDAFDTPDKNPDNSCYCDGNERDCLQAGLADVTPCYFNVPAAISYPHFLYGDERLVQAIDGISPNEERHSSYFSVLPDLGVAVVGHCKIQVNLVARTGSMRSIAAFNNMILPLIWFDTIIGPYPDNMIFLMRLAVNEGPIIQQVLAILCLISGIILLLMVTSQKYFPLKHMKKKFCSISLRQISET